MAVGLATQVPTAAQNVHVPQDSVLAIARDAYGYLAPLVYTDATRIASATEDNVFYHQRIFPDYTYRQVVAVNHDTNYSMAFLNLHDGPVVLVTPDTKGRYIVVPFLDAWTNNFELVGQRTTGTQSQKLLVSNARWAGKVPEGFRHVVSPTDYVWVIGRIQVNSKEDQVDNVSKLQDWFRLTTLAKWEKGDTSSAGVPQKIYYPIPKTQYGNGVAAGIRNLPIETFFNYANALLQDNPPFAFDSAIVRRIRQVGVGKGLRFSLADFDTATQTALRGLTASIYKNLGVTSAVSDGENVKKNQLLGNFGSDYAYRFLVAVYGLGALPQEEAIYIGKKTDADGQSLYGNSDYIIHFDKGKLPPAKAFWSVTLYDKDRYLSQNEIGRYAIGDRDKLKFNADGSLDIYVGHKNPGADRAANWLPAPADNFYLITRIYVPDARYVKDRKFWKEPEVRKTTY
ncbi:MAG: DUF1254 domain-containing protein [Chitinophagaceae bacterium]